MNSLVCNVAVLHTGDQIPTFIFTGVCNVCICRLLGKALWLQTQFAFILRYTHVLSVALSCLPFYSQVIIPRQPTKLAGDIEMGSVRPSVRHISFPELNYKSPQDIFTKFGTHIKQVVNWCLLIFSN